MDDLDRLGQLAEPLAYLFFIAPQKRPGQLEGWVRGERGYQLREFAQVAAGAVVGHRHQAWPHETSPRPPAPAAAQTSLRTRTRRCRSSYPQTAAVPRPPRTSRR